MLSIIKSIALHGLDGYLIDVQVDVSGGLPFWEIVGLPDVSVKEAKERVKTAIKNSGLDFQSKRIIVNLAPADTKKEGSSFDLPIAIGILQASEYIDKTDENTAFLGELSLDGKLNKINGVLPMCIEAKKLGVKKIILPKDNANEAGVVKGINIIPADNLKEVIDYLNKEIEIQPINIDIDKYFENSKKEKVDFFFFLCQESIKRAFVIAAAGGHNLLLIGSPGSRENNAF